MDFASVLFVLSQLVLAAVFEASWLSETDQVTGGTFLGLNSTMLLVVAQVVTVAAGFWLGVSWPTRRHKLFVCGAVPVALVTWYMVQSWFSAQTQGWWWFLVVVPAMGGTALLFAPSGAGVAVGRLLGRRARRHQAQQA